MNWDDLRIISAICSTGSFTRAARELQIDETTVSRRLARLESALDVILFEAVDGHREPTSACRAILGHLDEMKQTVVNISRVLSGQDHAQRSFRLTTIAAVAEHFLAPHLAALLAELPELTLSIDTSDHNVDMSRWEADFAIRLGRPKQGAFLMRKIGQMRFCLVRPANDGLAARAIAAAYPVALSETPEMVHLRTLLEDRPIQLETTNLDIIRRVLASGRAVAALPEFLAADFHHDSGLTVVPLNIEREVWLLSQAHLRNDPLARRVAEWCTNLIAASTAGTDAPDRAHTKI